MIQNNSNGKQFGSPIQLGASLTLDNHNFGYIQHQRIEEI